MIQQVTLEDLDEVIEIMETIKAEMREEENPQWGSTEDDYPSIKQLTKDIEKHYMVKYVEDDKLKGIISIVIETKLDFDDLPESSKELGYVLHRLAIPKEFRKQNIATKLMNYAEERARINKIKVVKASTELSNTKMNNLLLREGFVCKGEYSYDDYPGLYNYYEKEI